MAREFSSPIPTTIRVVETRFYLSLFYFKLNSNLLNCATREYTRAMSDILKSSQERSRKRRLLLAQTVRGRQLLFCLRF